MGIRGEVTLSLNQSIHNVGKLLAETEFPQVDPQFSPTFLIIVGQFVRNSINWPQHNLQKNLEFGVPFQRWAAPKFSLLFCHFVTHMRMQYYVILCNCIYWNFVSFYFKFLLYIYACSCHYILFCIIYNINEFIIQHKPERIIV